MEEFILSYLHIASNNIFHEVHDLIFWYSFSFLKKWAEISLLAVFGDDVAVCGLANDVKAFEDVGVFEFGECLDLAI